MSTSISEEFSRAELGDPRRVRRLQQIAESLSSEPSAGLPTLAAGDAELEGVYRFFNNANVSLETIIRPHYLATAERLGSADFVVAHDTTEFRFDGRVGLEELGRLDRQTTRGFFGHFALAMTNPRTRNAQGLLNLEPMFRMEAPARKKIINPQNSEATRWWKAANSVSEILGEKKKQAIHVMDREADTFTILWRMTQAEHRFVIRAKYQERGAQENEHEEKQTLQTLLLGAQSKCQREVELGKRKSTGDARKDRLHPPRQARQATLNFSARSVCLRRPTTAAPDAPELLTVNVVDVREENVPEGCVPVRWILYTTEPIQSPQDVERVVDFYHCRWGIEEYFKALKTGCAFEKRQLKSRQAVLSALGVFAVIAWQLLTLRAHARAKPDADARTIFSETQLELLRAHQKMRNKKPLVAHATIAQAVEVVAQLGGHIKNNGLPGWIVLARGYENLMMMELGWRLSKARA